jgi:hypothetical protein
MRGELRLNTVRVGLHWIGQTYSLASIKDESKADREKEGARTPPSAHWPVYITRGSASPTVMLWTANALARHDQRAGESTNPALSGKYR